MKPKNISIGIWKSGSCRTLVASATTLLAVGASSAATKDYNGGGIAGDWTDAANWTGGIPATGDIANISIISGPNVVTAVGAVGELWVGQGGGNTGFATLGAGGSIQVNNWTAIGRGGGNGTLNQTGGSFVQDNGGAFMVASRDGGNSTGFYTQTGGTLEVKNNAQFWIGNGDGTNGTLTSTNGTITANNLTAIGVNGAGTGTLTLNGGSVFNKQGNSRFIVGFNNLANGTLNIAGGTLNTLNGASEFWVGQGGGSTGLVTQTLGTSQFNAASWVAIGRGGGSGTYNLSGGLLNHTAALTHIVIAGEAGSSTGSMTVNGTGVVTTPEDIWVAENANQNGTLTLAGTASISSPRLLATVNGGTANINLNDGTLNVQQVLGGAGTSNGSFNGTLIVAQAGVGNSAFISNITTATIGTNGLKIDSNGQTLASNQVFGGAGGVVKSGSGSLNLTANSTFSGAIAINAGTLFINGNLGSTSGASVASTAILGGSGTVDGSSIIASGGTISPGNSVGTINVGTIDLQSGSNYLVEASANGVNDVINASGAIVANGNINMMFAYTPVYGDSFDIANFSGLITGTPNFTQTGLAPGDSLDTSLFSTTGVVTVVPEVNTWLPLLSGFAVLSLLRRRNRE